MRVSFIGRIVRQRRFSGIIAITLFASLTGLWLPHQGAAQAIPPNPRVELKLLDELQANGSADFVIEMAEQADLSAAYTISDWNERGRYVVDTLKAAAETSQKDVRGQLERQGALYTAYFASNVVVVRGGSQRALEAVANLPGVARVRAPIMVRLEPVEDVLARAVDIHWPQAKLQSAVAWGLTDTRATDFWSAFGRQGEGIIVANIDSGVKYDHPALASAYLCAGGNLLDARCWLDATTDPPLSGPQDDLGHGTHTMGTMVGSNNPSLSDHVGMAPGARWIACRAFIGNRAEDADLLECAQWILAPGGDAANRPHVVNNSWGDKASNPWFSDNVDAWYASGIFSVFSAGNDGSAGCSTIGSPADYQKGFSVAAHNILRSNASFSSRGPNDLGDSPFTKPNISAPGVFIQSSIISGGFGTSSGTSMAAPHASGAAALLWSCNPYLVGNIGLTFTLLQGSADAPPVGTCGGPASGAGNYTYGYGYLNVYQAGQIGCGIAPVVYFPLIMR